MAHSTVKYVTIEFGNGESSKSVNIFCPFVVDSYQLLTGSSRFSAYQSTSAFIINSDLPGNPVIGCCITDQHVEYPIVKLQNFSNGTYNFYLTTFSGAVGAGSGTNTINILLAFYPK